MRAYLDHLTVERGLARNTLSSYRRDLRRYGDFLAGRALTDLGAVSAADVSAFLVHLREGDVEHPPLSAASAARTVVAVRGLHRFALREGVVSRDVASDVRPPTPRRRLPKALAVADIESIIATAGAAWTTLALQDR